MNELESIKNSLVASEPGQVGKNKRKKSIKKYLNLAGKNDIKVKRTRAVHIRHTRLIIVLDATASQHRNWRAIQNGIVQIVTDLDQVARAMTSRMQIEIAMIAYRDYPPHAPSDKLIEFHGFTSDAEVLKQFSLQIKCSDGGDNAAEAVEVGLHKTCSLFQEMNSQDNCLIVLIGDEAAYGVKNSLAEKPNNEMYWEDEIARLVQMDVPVYSVFSGFHSCQVDRKFFWECANRTEGKFFELEEIADLSDLITAVVSKSAGQLEEFKRILIIANRMTPSKNKLIETCDKPILTLEY